MTVGLGADFRVAHCAPISFGPLAIHPRVFSRPPLSFTVTTGLPPAAGSVRIGAARTCCSTFCERETTRSNPIVATTWASAPACRSLGPASTHLLSPIDWSSLLTLVPRTFHLPSFSYLSEFDIEVSAELDREKVLEEPFLVV